MLIYKMSALRTSIKNVKGTDFYDRLLLACQEIFPGRIGRIIATEMAVMYYLFSWRKKHTRREPLENISELEQGTDLPDPNNVNEYVILALSQMKADEALVLRLFYLSELSIEEVISVTSFSKSKVKVTLHRGRKNLADLLRKYLGKEIEDL